MNSTDICYFPGCPDHISPTGPPKNPQATIQQLIKWRNSIAKQRMHDLDANPKYFKLWVDYMETVHNDTDAILWGWLYAEEVGFAWWEANPDHKGEGNWRIK